MKAINVILTGLILLCVPAIHANAADDIKTAAKGKWEITIPDAPDGFQKYVIDIREKNGVVVMDVNGGGLDIKEQGFTEKDGKLKTNLYVGESVTLLIWQEKGTVKGSAATSIGTLPITFTKVKEKKTK